MQQTEQKRYFIKNSFTESRNSQFRRESLAQQVLCREAHVNPRTLYGKRMLDNLRGPVEKFRAARESHYTPSQSVRWAPHAQSATIQDMRIGHRRAEIRMSQQFLNGPDVRSGLE